MYGNDRHHRLPGSFFIRRALLARPHKTKIPSQHFCWDRILPAVPPGLTRLFQKRALFSRTDIRGSLLTEKSAPSPLLRPERGPFLLALGSPFGLTLSAALAPIRGSLRESWGGLLTLPHRFGKRIPPESKPCQERGRKKFQRFKAVRARTPRGGPARRPLFLDIAPLRVVQLKPAARRCGGMVDTRDLKSLAGNRVPVRVRSPALKTAPPPGGAVFSSGGPTLGPAPATGAKRPWARSTR